MNKKIIAFLLIGLIFLSGCTEKGLPLTDEFKDEKINTQTEVEGVDVKIVHQAQGWSQRANEVFNKEEPLKTDWSVYRDIYTDANNYFVDYHSSPTFDEYLILAPTIDMWVTADELLKTTNKEEKLNLAMDINTYIKNLEQKLKDLSKN